MRIAAAIDLSARERKRLHQNVKSRTTPRRLIERSKILLLADEGVNNQMIASQLGITENKVGRWRNRYAEDGLKAIKKDRPRGKNHGGKKKRIFLHFIPTSSSWLNMVERFFGILTDKRLRRGVFMSVKELETALEDLIVQHNKNPKPFVWTKSTEEILEKVGRARETRNNLHSD